MSTQAPNGLNSRANATPIQDNYIQETPSTRQYYVKTIATAIIGSEIIRQSDWANYLISTQPIEDSFRWLSSKIVPGANAQGTTTPPAQNTAPVQQPVVQQPVVTQPPVAPQPVVQQPVVTAQPVVQQPVVTPPVAAQQTAQAANETSTSWFADKLASAKNVGSSVTSPIANFIANNPLLGRVLLVGTFAGTFAAVNHLASERIKDSRARAIVSFGVASVAVWTLSNHVVGHSIDALGVIDVGIQMIVSAKVLQVATPYIQKGLARASYLAKAFTWDVSFPVVAKEKSA